MRDACIMLNMAFKDESITVVKINLMLQPQNKAVSKLQRYLVLHFMIRMQSGW